MEGFKLADYVSARTTSYASDMERLCATEGSGAIIPEDCVELMHEVPVCPVAVSVRGPAFVNKNENTATRDDESDSNGQERDVGRVDADAGDVGNVSSSSSQGVVSAEYKYNVVRADTGEATLHLITNTRPFVCGICDKKFRNPQTLRMHQKTHVNEQHEHRVDEKCVATDAKTNGSSRTLNARFGKTSGKNKKIPSKCPVCEKVFCGLYELRRHFGRKHSGGKKVRYAYIRNHSALLLLRRCTFGDNGAHCSGPVFSRGREADKCVYWLLAISQMIKEETH